MNIPFTESVCHIDLDAIVRNFARLGPSSLLMPVVKSDAYGHGLLEVAKSLANAGARRFAVGLPAEGAALRKAGIEGQIVPLMGCLTFADWELALKYSLTPIIGSFEDIQIAGDLLNDYADKSLDIAIKCDTGMRRLGFELAQVNEVCEQLSRTSALRPDLLISHLACADMPEEEAYTREQFGIFEEFYGIVKRRFPSINRSLGNSAGTLHNRAYEVMRPGLALYGYSPLPDGQEDGLEPAMAVSTPVMHIRELLPGQSVSYGRIFTAERRMRIAIVGCGYATGVLRSLSGKMEMLLNGRRVKQIGRICMSMCMLDTSAIPEVKVGDRAWIMGGPNHDGNNAVDARELAGIAGTIPYEILCLLGSLNPRAYR